MIEIFLLEQLIAFSESGTLSKAAEILHISQPALTRSTKKLEDEIGVPLFERTKGRIALNENGELAVKHARKVLEADTDMIETVRLFDKSRRTLSVGSCASFPLYSILSRLQQCFNNVLISTEIADDEKLIRGLENYEYNIVITRTDAANEAVYYKRYMEENLMITIPENHYLAAKVKDLDGMIILAHGQSGFWIDICRKNLPNTKIIIEDDIETLSEIADASTLPVFNSDRVIESLAEQKGKKTIYISDDSAHAVYYIAYLRKEMKRYSML